MSNAVAERSAELSQDIIKAVQKQALEVDESSNGECSNEQRIACAMKYGDQAIDNKILISISETINDMAKEIGNSEASKNSARKEHMAFFRRVLIIMLIFVGSLIVLNAIDSIAITVPAEVFISVLIVILADVFAIIQSFVKYMNSVEHYKVYNSLIDSLLKHLNHGKSAEQKD